MGPLPPTTPPTAMLPLADIWLTLSELSTLPREKLRLSLRLRPRLRLSPKCSTTPMEARVSSTPPSTPTVTPLSTPDIPGPFTSLLTTTTDTGTSTERERLILSPRLRLRLMPLLFTDVKDSTRPPSTPPTPLASELSTPDTGTSSSQLASTTEDTTTDSCHLPASHPA